MRAVIHIRRLSCLVTLAIAASCGPGKGSVQGDVYFTGTQGAPVRAAGVTVELLHGGDSAAAAIDRVCEQEMRESIRLKLALSQAMTSGMAHVGELGSDEDLASYARYAPIVNATKDTIRTLSQETLKRLAAIEQSATSDSSVTRIDAHYRFATVPAGKYIVLARGVYGGEFRGWLAPVEVRAKRDTTVDLSPATEHTDRLTCGITPSDLAGADPGSVAAARQAGATLSARRGAALAAARAEKRFADSVHKAAVAEMELDHRLPWIADDREMFYYNFACVNIPPIPKGHQRRFRTREEAEAAGFKRSPQPGC